MIKQIREKKENTHTNKKLHTHNLESIGDIRHRETNKVNSGATGAAMKENDIHY